MWSWGSDTYGKVSDAPWSYSEVATGQSSARALRTDGVPTCWGDVINWSTPTPSTQLEGLNMGFGSGQKTCAIEKSSGAITCWGEPVSEFFDAIPAGVYSAVDLGSQPFGCALDDTSGTIDCWQYNLNGNNAGAEVGAPSGSFDAIALGYNWGCAIDSADELSCWGRQGPTYWYASDAPSGTFQSVATADSTGCAVSTDGEITCWGLTATVRSPARQRAIISPKL